MKPEEIKRKLGEYCGKVGSAGKKAVSWFRNHGKMTAVLGALALVLVALAVMPGRGGGDGNGAKDGLAGGTGNGVDQGADDLKPPVQAPGQQSETALKGRSVDQGILPGPQLERDQIELLDRLTEVLKGRDLEAGGSLLLDHEQKLEYLFYQVMKGEYYLYRDGRLYGELDGEGLVLTRSTAAFYGTFENGMPEGSGVSVQGIELDGLRYDYADGQWSGGKLDGEAEAGYHYYEGSGDGESLEVKRAGTFVEDLMDGAFTYETVSADGEVTVWDMEAENGKTKLDDRWVHDEEKQYYYLPSRDISNHTYVIPDSEMAESAALEWVMRENVSM